MSFSRYDESLLRQLLPLVDLGVAEPEALAARLAQLRRGLAPEDEFSLLISWLGKCKLVHKLGQEQLPLGSIDEYRVPDLLAVFDHEGALVPTLIEVKKTDPRDPNSLEPGALSLKPGYQKYAELVDLPLLIAWRHRTFWTLFEFRHTHLAEVNYRIGFLEAMQQNLLGILANDFSYKVAGGTRIEIRVRKLSEPDEKGSFKGEIEDVHFVSPTGERIPNIPYLHLLFYFWENETELIDDGDAIIQSFVIPELEGRAEFASRTLCKIVEAVAAMNTEEVNWPAILHDSVHWVHTPGQFRKVVEEGKRYGVITETSRLHPADWPRLV